MSTRVGKEARLPVVERLPQCHCVRCWWRILAWLDKTEDRMIIFSPSGHPSSHPVTMWSWRGWIIQAGRSRRPVRLSSLSTVFVYGIVRTGFPRGRSLNSDGFKSAECNLLDLGSPDALECKAQGHTDQMSYCVCNVVVDMPRSSALCNALQQGTGELQGSPGSLRRARARETHQQYMQTWEPVAGKLGLVGLKRNLGAKQGRTLLPAWPIPSLVSCHQIHERTPNGSGA